MSQISLQPAANSSPPPLLSPAAAGSPAAGTPKGLFASMSVSLDFTTTGNPVLRLNILPANPPPSTTINLRLVQPQPVLCFVIQQPGSNRDASSLILSIDCNPDESTDNSENSENSESPKCTHDKSSSESKSATAHSKEIIVPPEHDYDSILNDPEQTDRGTDRGHTEKAGTSNLKGGESRPGEETADSESNFDADNADSTRHKLLPPSTKLSSAPKPGTELAKQSEHNRAGQNSQDRKAPVDPSSAKQSSREGASNARPPSGTGGDKGIPKGPTNSGNTAGANPNTSSQNTSQAGQNLLNNLATLLTAQPLAAQPQIMEGPKQPPAIILNNPGSGNRSSNRKKSRREEEKEREREHEQERRERSADLYDDDDDGLDN